MEQPKYQQRQSGTPPPAGSRQNHRPPPPPTQQQQQQQQQQQLNQQQQRGYSQNSRQQSTQVLPTPIAARNAIHTSSLAETMYKIVEDHDRKRLEIQREKERKLKESQENELSEIVRRRKLESESNSYVGGRMPTFKQKKKNRIDNCRDGAILNVPTEFTCAGTLDEFQQKNPLQLNGEGNLIWDGEYTDDLTTTSASPWRSVHDTEGVLKEFMAETSHKKAILMGGKISKVTNSFPFPIGIFSINGSVTRTPDNPLYAGVVAKIMEAFYSSTHGKTDNSHISLIRVVPANQSISWLQDDGTFYYKSDTETNNDNPRDKELNASTISSEDVRYAKTWMGITKESIRSGIMLRDTHTSVKLFKGMMGEGKSMGDEPLSFIYSDSTLWKFIFHNWTFLTDDRTPIPNIPVWNIHKSIYHCLMVDDCEKNDEQLECEFESIRAKYGPEEQYYFSPVLKSVVDEALRRIDEIIDKLPFASLEKHQLFIARMDGTTNFTQAGQQAKENVIEALRLGQSTVGVTVTINNVYEVVISTYYQHQLDEKASVNGGNKYVDEN